MKMAGHLLRIQNGIFQLNLSIFAEYFKVPPFWNHILISAPMAEQRDQQKFCCSIFEQAKDIPETWFLGFFWYCSSKKLL